MFLQGIETAGMIVMNQKRMTGLSLDESFARLSTGKRIINPGDDPSGLAIGAGMRAHLQGISTAMGNLQEGILLVHSADSALSQIHDILMREREISVRGANEAVQYTATGADPSDVHASSERALAEELDTWEQELYQVTNRDNFNNKSLLFGFQNGQNLQVGPDNQAADRVQVVIPFIGIMGRMAPTFMPGDMTHDQFVAAFRNQIDQCDADIAIVADARAKVGAQENTLNKALDGLMNEYQNVSGALSNIMDTDIAEEIVKMTKNQIIDNAAGTALVRADTEKGIIKQLCDAVGLDASQRVNKQ
jgi:flagellin